MIQGKNESGSMDKFIRKVKVGEISLTAFVDMGASVNTVKSTIVLREDWKMQRKKSLIGGFGMGEIESPGIINENVEFNNLKQRVLTFRVVPDTAKQFDIILGRPFTEAPDLGYTRRGNELMFSEIEPHVLNYNKTINKIRVDEDIVLECGSVNFISVTRDNDEASLPVVNAGDKVISLKQGQKLENILWLLNLYQKLKKGNHC